VRPWRQMRIGSAGPGGKDTSMSHEKLLLRGEARWQARPLSVWPLHSPSIRWQPGIPPSSTPKARASSCRRCSLAASSNTSATIDCRLGRSARRSEVQLRNGASSGHPAHQRRALRVPRRLSRTCPELSSTSCPETKCPSSAMPASRRLRRMHSHDAVWRRALIVVVNAVESIPG
jgi:hypothetical protein